MEIAVRFLAIEWGLSTSVVMEISIWYNIVGNNGSSSHPVLPNSWTTSAVQKGAVIFMSSYFVSAIYGLRTSFQPSMDVLHLLEVFSPSPVFLQSLARSSSNNTYLVLLSVSSVKPFTSAIFLLTTSQFHTYPSLIPQVYRFWRTSLTYGTCVFLFSWQSRILFAIPSSSIFLRYP